MYPATSQSQRGINMCIYMRLITYSYNKEYNQMYGLGMDQVRCWSQTQFCDSIIGGNKDQKQTDIAVFITKVVLLQICT